MAVAKGWYGAGIVNSIGCLSRGFALENWGALGRDGTRSQERVLGEWEEGAAHSEVRKGKGASQSPEWNTGIEDGR